MISFIYRQTYGTATFGLSAELLHYLVETFYAEINPIFSSIKGFTPALVLQPLSVPLLTASHQAGGNPLGVSARHGPLTLMSFALQWSDSANDNTIIRMERRLIAKYYAFAKSLQLDNRFIYQNYATLDQDVFDGYGLKNKAKLQRIARKYDCDGVFRILQPGYFKLF